MNAQEEYALVQQMIKAAQRKLKKKTKDRLFLEAELYQLTNELEELENKKSKRVKVKANK